MGFSSTGDKIILIQHGSNTGFSKLDDHHIKTLFRGQDWILGSAPDTEILLAERAGFSVEIVDDTPWSASYYFVSTPERGFPPHIPSSFEVLARLPEGVIVEGSNQDTRDLYERNFWIVNI